VDEFLESRLSLSVASATATTHDEHEAREDTLRQIFFAIFVSFASFVREFRDPGH
jgi:hypothetical protein